ncbi:MAG: TATA-box binding protein (TBP) (component of TFIID and TFIIIB) [Candidatus Poseidoniaceae archaeon]|jgi:TATA-box binding protein (TBP) (component of TFIID and TFIIIB)|tara:strand:+ start:649 stop:1188 length:540 start_codon:yes stop_codon:yes gene_type:complete
MNMPTTAIAVRIENHLVRFIAPSPIDQQAVISQLGGQETSGVVIKVLDSPRATLVIDGQGRITVHGTHRVEAARAAAKELMLRLGLSDSGLETELGPVIASFDFGKPLNISQLVGSFGAGTAVYDERLGCSILEDTRHNLTIHVWPNGRCIVPDARHQNIVAMAAVYWRNQLKDKNLFI